MLTFKNFFFLFMISLPAWIYHAEVEAFPILLRDDAEHSFCFGLNTKNTNRPGNGPKHFLSTCAADQSGAIRLTEKAAHTGRFGYELPVTQGDLPSKAFTGGLHNAKMSADTQQLKSRQKIGGTIRYSAYFYIESGFDDFGRAWHVQMQWKGYDANRHGSEKYWPAQNPKIAWGFRRLGNSHQDAGPLQAVATVREAYSDSCQTFSYHLFTRENTLGLPPLEIPRRQWIQIVVEIHFHQTAGSIQIWQKNENEPASQIIKVTDINTASQLVQRSIAKTNDRTCASNDPSSLFYTSPTHFTFGIANYLSGLSFDSRYRTENSPHILYVDDILIEDVTSSPESPSLRLEFPARPQP